MAIFRKVRLQLTILTPPQSEIPTNILRSVFLPVISCAGILGIVLTMVVLSRKTMATSTNAYLTALAVADLCFLLILMSRILAEQVVGCLYHIKTAWFIFDTYTSSLKWNFARLVDQNMGCLKFSDNFWISQCQIKIWI